MQAFYMVALRGASSNPEQLAAWREIAKLKRAAARRRTPSDPDSGERLARKPGWVWLELRKLLAKHSEPVTPKVLQGELEAKLGAPVPASTVKDCLRRNADARRELRRYKGGKYRLVASG